MLTFSRLIVFRLHPIHPTHPWLASVRPQRRPLRARDPRPRRVSAAAGAAREAPRCRPAQRGADRAAPLEEARRGELRAGCGAAGVPRGAGGLLGHRHGRRRRSVLDRHRPQARPHQGPRRRAARRRAHLRAEQRLERQLPRPARPALADGSREPRRPEHRRPARPRPRTVERKRPTNADGPRAKPRSAESRVEEVVLATSPSLEGDGTALYLEQELADLGVRVTRIARGLSAGQPLDTASKAVLGDALHHRGARPAPTS